MEIVNLRTCPIIIDVNINGGCFGTSTCTIPTGGALKFIVAASSTVFYPDIITASAAAVAGSYSCLMGTYEYVRAGIQNKEECECRGGGVTVGEPCLIMTGFGPTCNTGFTTNASALFTPITTPIIGRAKITAY